MNFCRGSNELIFEVRRLDAGAALKITAVLGQQALVELERTLSGTLALIIKSLLAELRVVVVLQVALVELLLVLLAF